MRKIIVDIKGNEKQIKKIQDQSFKELIKKYPEEFKNKELIFNFGKKHFQMVSTSDRIINEIWESKKKKSMKLKIKVLKKFGLTYNIRLIG